MTLGSWPVDAIHKATHEHIKLATVGNPGLHLATWAGGLPGVSSVLTLPGSGRYTGPMAGSR